MTFTLQPGDYIPTSEVPADKRQAVINAFVAAGGKCNVKVAKEQFHIPEYVGLTQDMGIRGANGFDTWGMFTRRVTLEQILGEQIAKNANSLETRKPGDYVTIEQMEREAEHWQRVGPELLAALLPFLPAYQAFVDAMNGFRVSGETSSDRFASEQEREATAQEEAFLALSEITFDQLNDVNNAITKARSIK